MAGKILASQRCLCPTPRNCDYITLHGQKDFAGEIKLKILRWEDYFRLFKWVQCNHKGPKRKGVRRVRLREGDVTTEVEVGVRGNLEPEKGSYGFASGVSRRKAALPTLRLLQPTWDS